MAWWSREKKKKEPEKRSVPKGLFQKCDDCGATVETQKVRQNLSLCPHCGHHFILPTEERIRLTLDEGSFVEEDLSIQPEDPLEFRDSKRYADRLRAAQKQVGVPDAFRSGIATLGGRPVSVGLFVFEFMGGSMGSVVGEKIARRFERAIEMRCPAILFSASGGARMQEGILSLMQMAKTTAALAKLKEAGLPYLSVLLHPTTGGVAASFAMLGDVILAEPKALIGFAGPRVIEQTIRQKLPEGFQRSEFLLQHGMIDMIVPRREMRERLIELVALLAPARAA
jgi:acetyl-CoA carboxylase carboxyl transferase subunit beta